MDREFLAETIYNYNIDTKSPTCVTMEQVPVYEKDGSVRYDQKPQDLKSLIESNGSVFDWELEAMLKAGVPIDTSIRTGNSDRLSVESQLQQLSADIDVIGVSDPVTTDPVE